MTQGHPARTPAELRRAMDDLFRKVLADGERRRAAYPPGPPPWTPDASDIDEDDDLELDRIWEEARPMRKIADLDAVLGARGLHLDPSAPGTAAIRRDAMHVHIQARTIDAEREEGDYSTNALAPTLPPHLAAIAPRCRRWGRCRGGRKDPRRSSAKSSTPSARRWRATPGVTITPPTRARPGSSGPS